MDWTFVRAYSLKSEKFIKLSNIPSQIRQILGKTKRFDRQPILFETRKIKMKPLLFIGYLVITLKFWVAVELVLLKNVLAI